MTTPTQHAKAATFTARRLADADPQGVLDSYAACTGICPAAVKPMLAALRDALFVLETLPVHINVAEIVDRSRAAIHLAETWDAPQSFEDDERDGLAAKTVTSMKGVKS